MSALSFIAATVICTSVYTPSADPHALEHVTRVFVDENNAKAEVREYSFKAQDAWGLDDIESLLVETNMSAPARKFEVEDIVWARQGDNAAMELYNNDTITWRLEAILRVAGDQGSYEVEQNGSTNSAAMSCKR
ncbi:hypothetical protein EBZ80_24430 [bacterium]|nr:hypothetical protein [bacterium]